MGQECPSAVNALSQWVKSALQLAMSLSQWVKSALQLSMPCHNGSRVPSSWQCPCYNGPQCSLCVLHGHKADNHNTEARPRLSHPWEDIYNCQDKEGPTDCALW
ncbi:hypothetical protein ACOMHN_028249 [Nucella lapillus]